jgi:NAD+ synthase (glutamine-hydrolysing)
VSGHGAQVVVFLELALGYPPEDLLRAPASVCASSALCLRRSARCLGAVGCLARRARTENVAGLIRGGELVAEYAKMELLNYQAFDERIVAGDSPCDRYEASASRLVW